MIFNSSTHKPPQLITAMMTFAIVGFVGISEANDFTKNWPLAKKEKYSLADKPPPFRTDNCIEQLTNLVKNNQYYKPFTRGYYPTAELMEKDKGKPIKLDIWKGSIVDRKYKNSVFDSDCEFKYDATYADGSSVTKLATLNVKKVNYPIFKVKDTPNRQYIENIKRRC